MGISVIPKDGVEYDEEFQNFVEDLENNDSTEFVNYYDCHGIDLLPEDDFDRNFNLSDDEWEDDNLDVYESVLEDMIDSYRGNPTW
jgi:hypothetical protein